jgi:protein-tyrosine phosphatase
MIDIHCHILPGLDDGARTMDEALSMARIAAADGIDTLVASSHITPGVYDNSPDRIIAAGRPSAPNSGRKASRCGSYPARMSG